MQLKSLAELISSSANTEVRVDEPMSKHTSLKIGGAADIFVSPKGVESLQKIIDIAEDENVKYFIIGNGTNLLVADDGVRGIVIQIKEGFGRIIFKKTREFAVIKTESGVLLSRIVNITKENGLSGFEFAAGIPGSMGGAVAMNASTRLGAISDVIHSIEVLNCKTKKIKKIKYTDLDFAYRQLNIDRNAVILNSVFHLTYKEKAKVSKTVDDFLSERRAAQPAGQSAGCIFKNTKTEPAGKIIDELGLKGSRIGGAFVSDVHANFIMNDGTATCKDFIDLIRNIRRSVLEKKGTKLEYEIKFLGNV